MIHFDAHSDTWDSYFGGHTITHGTLFRRAVEEGLLDPKRTIQIGIRGSVYDLQRSWTSRAIQGCAWSPSRNISIPAGRR